jgi:hypothetical protein
MNSSRYPPPQSLDMVERAIFLLRSLPAIAWAVEAAGAIPLLLSVLYFGLDMTARAALVCAAFFLWFNVCRARFAQLLMSALSDQSPASWKQAFDPVNLAMQSCKLFTMPLAIAAVIPLGWTVAWFRTPGRSAKLAGLWQRQTWLVLGILALFSAVVFVNLLLLLAALPVLVKAVSGVENEFTRLGFALNGTVIAVAAGLTWLLFDPLYQAVFCVRAFLAESRDTGRDIVYALRHLAALLILATVAVSPVRAQAPPPQASAAELDASVERVLEQPEYAWRIPRQHASKPRLFDGFIAQIRAVFRRVVRWLGELIDRIFRNFLPGESPAKPSAFPAVRWTVIVLIALLAAALGFLLVRLTRSRRDADSATPAQAPRVLNLADEQISAADFPEEKWIELGRECLAGGDYRLALRAFYLANLSWLGRRELLTIAPFKSNRDYWRELRRRARSEALREAFSRNMTMFERGWYGVHPVDAEQVSEFERNFAAMRSHVEA